MTQTIEQLKVTEGNKLIAEFMGFEWLGPPMNAFYKNKICVGELQFHASYDWLMPVVEKICEIHNHADVELYRAIEKADLQIIHNTSILCHKDGVYARVVEFIQWFNNQNPAK
jgi:hypothetical protein